MSSRVKYRQYFIFYTYFQPTSPYFNLVHRIGTTVNYIHPPLRSTTFMTVRCDHGFRGVPSLVSPLYGGFPHWRVLCIEVSPGARCPLKGGVQRREVSHGEKRPLKRGVSLRDVSLMRGVP